MAGGGQRSISQLGRSAKAAVRESRGGNTLAVKAVRSEAARNEPRQEFHVRGIFLMTGQETYALILVAICIWREARGESMEAKRGVGWTIRNRVLAAGWFGKGWVDVILKPW